MATLEVMPAVMRRGGWWRSLGGSGRVDGVVGRAEFTEDSSVRSNRLPACSSPTHRRMLVP
jgi:hypothetical protein